MKRSLIDAVRKERGKYSNNQLAKKLGITKRDLLNVYKILEREDRSARLKSGSKFSFRLNRFAHRVGTFFQSPFRGAIAIFLVGVLIRFAILLALRHDPLLEVPILDAEYYSDWAKKIVSGERYPSTAFFTEPGYAYMLALFYKIFGEHSLPIIVFQMFLGCLSSILLFLSAWKMTGSRWIGYGIGFFSSLFSATLFYELVLLKTSPEFFLLSLLIFALAYFWNDLNLKRIFLLGVLIGVNALFKANIFYASLFLVAIFVVQTRPFFTRRKVAILSLFVAGVFMCIAPVTIRNFVMSRSFVLINSSGGANLYIGNWEGTDGTLRPPEYISTVPSEEENDWHRVAENYARRPLSPAEVSSFWTGKAMDRIIHHPIVFMKNAVRKASLLFSAGTLGDDYNRSYVFSRTKLFFFTVPDFLILAGGFLGIILLILSREARFRYAPFLALLLGYALTLIVSHVTERYRVALFPFLLLFFGFALLRMKEYVYDRDARKIFVFGTSFLVLSLLVLLPPKGISGTTISDMLVNFGSAFEEKKDMKQASRLYEESLKLNARHVPTLGKLGRLELLEGNFQKSIETYRSALLVQYEFPADDLYLAIEAKEKNLSLEEVRSRADARDADMKNHDEKYDINAIEGLEFMRKREYENAVLPLEMAMDHYPKSSSILSNVATAYKNTKRPDDAVRVFEQLLKDHPDALQARFNYANLLSTQKTKLADAEKQYEEINRVVPGYYISRFYLGLTYEENGSPEKAREAFKQFIQEAGSDLDKQSFVQKAKDALKRLGQRD